MDVNQPEEPGGIAPYLSRDTAFELQILYMDYVSAQKVACGRQ